MSERSTWPLSVIYSTTFWVFNSVNAAVTGLVNGNFTKQLTLDDVNNATAVTVTEVDAVNEPGLYKATYTPGTTGKWDLRVYHTTHAPRGWQDTIQVYALDPNNPDAILDHPAAVDGYTLREIFRLYAAALGGISSGSGANATVIRDLTDTVDRITSTEDGNGDRLTVTLDLA